LECLRYDEQNPEIWELFKRFTFHAIHAGRKHVGSRLIIERIRWESIVRAIDKDYKINNNLQPYYARKFMRLFPPYKGLFETRKGRM